MTTLELPPQPTRQRPRIKNIRPPARAREVQCAVQTASHSTVSLDRTSGSKETPIKMISGGRPEYLVGARFAPPSSIVLDFSDARFSLAIELLEMPMDRIRWKTAAAAPGGSAMTVMGI